MTRKTRTSKLNQQIDDNLRRVYSQAAEEPVPERFTELLQKLRKQEQEQEQEQENKSPENGGNGEDK
jgi:hypothetical protein